jgi:hypothetical protein
MNVNFRESINYINIHFSGSRLYNNIILLHIDEHQELYKQVQYILYYYCTTRASYVFWIRNNKI